MMIFDTKMQIFIVANVITIIMTSNIVISPRFTPREVEAIDRLVSQGYYKSRAEVVRIAVRECLERNRIETES